MTKDSNVIPLDAWRQARRGNQSGGPPASDPPDSITQLKHAIYGLYFILRSRLSPEDQEFATGALRAFAQDPETGEEERNIYLDLLGIVHLPNPGAE